ncbi:DUF3566 domain-containing protein [Cellulomonas composti]|uniref:DUF3566 domain-containing protein n=1 Tax=Cellulomonas composti TaxID=266130 RepID=UPI001FEC3824|nr:DUF3566 domain-containing protein [Cellulomonas composti]
MKRAEELDSRETLDPGSRPESAAPPGDDGQLHDPPSPLMVAVDTTTGWIKKVAGATTAKISTATRPRTEDTPMTTTPTAPPSVGTSSPAAGSPSSGAGAAGSSAPAGPSFSPTSARPSTGRIPSVAPHSGGPRRVRLAISRIDPWSVMKLSFLLSVAFGVLIVVAVAVVWYTLNGLHVFVNINDLVTQITGAESKTDILQYVEFKRVISAATLVAVVDVFLLTALATIGAFLYNIVAALVGGLHVTMTDE